MKARNYFRKIFTVIALIFLATTSTFAITLLTTYETANGATNVTYRIGSVDYTPSTSAYSARANPITIRTRSTIYAFLGDSPVSFNYYLGFNSTGVSGTTIQYAGYAVESGGESFVVFEFNNYYFAIQNYIPLNVTSSISNQGYANDTFVVNSNANYLYCLRPNASSYENTNANTITIRNTDINGSYWFYAQSNANNKSSSYKITLDTITPTITGATSGYSNKPFIIRVSDTNLKAFYVKTPNETSFTIQQQTVYPVTENSTFGLYEFYAIDYANNRTETISVNYLICNDFGNFNKIQNNYKVSAWYNVKLTQSRYTDLSVLHYSFRDYESALSFAVEKELNYRVQTTSNGWVYSTADSYAKSQEYTSYDDLLLVVNKWAKTYISAEQKFSTGTNNYYNEIENLSDNSFEAPVQLTSLNDLETCIITPYFCYIESNIHNQTGYSHYVQLTYLGDILNGELIYSNLTKKIQIPFNKPLKECLEAESLYYQGYYLVEEFDDAGNNNKYGIYIDLTTASATITGTLGDGSTRQIDVATYDGTLYFVSLEVKSFVDNIENEDGILFFITGRNLDGITYSRAEDIPILCAENEYYGEYIIKVYDRSKNTTTLTLFVSSAVIPTMNWTSLTNDTKVTFTYTAWSSNNSIVSLKIYKILYDGTIIQLENDGDGTPINQLTLSYTFYDGGKYLSIIVDLYGRIIEPDAVFYTKGLPRGELNGVQNKGKTRKNVSFSYENDNVLCVYITDDGTKTQIGSDMYTSVAKDTITTITFVASETTSHQYLIVLYSNVDIQLYVEYQFEIDTFCAEVFIYDLNDTSIQYDGSTTTGFYINTAENGVRAYYYLNKDLNGSNTLTYSMNTKLTIDGIYYFTIYDSLGNTRTFTILIDSSVNFSVAGNYEFKDGKIVASNPISITVLEKYKTFDATSSLGVSFSNGEVISVDGNYFLQAEDQYGNKLSLEIIIDTIPPTYKLVGVANGGRTNTSVVLNFEENATAYITSEKGTIIEAVVNGKEFGSNGIYYIKIIDYAGNVVNLSFTIQNEVICTNNFVSGQILTGEVSIDFVSGATINVYLNGEKIDTQRKYKEIGQYRIDVTDELGNFLQLDFQIIALRYQKFEMDLPNGWNIVRVRQNGVLHPCSELKFDTTGTYLVTLNKEDYNYDFEIEVDNIAPTVSVIKNKDGSYSIKDANKENIVYHLYKNGKEIQFSTSQKVESNGSYRLVVVDELGNTSSYDFNIPYKMNGYALVVVIVFSLLLVSLVTIIIKSKKIKV